MGDMHLDIIRNAKRNIIFGIVSRIVAVCCPFITKTVIQYTLGEEYLGLNSLFSAILSVLSLAELGFGSAIIYSMYKPVADGDVMTVNALLNFYRKVYSIIGFVILTIGLLLLLFLKELITGSYPEDISLIALYLVYLGNAVISYFMYAYMSALIVVYQRDDINSRINMSVTLLLTVSQIFILLKLHNYLLFSLMMPVFTIFNNIRIAVFVKRAFPQYYCEGNIPEHILFELKKQIVGTLVQKLCGIARNSFDSICTSAFIGLAMTAKYNNYYSIIAAITSFMGIFSSALTGGIGNHSVTRNRVENFQELKEIDFLYMWASGWCTICLLCLSQPFMQLWMGKRMMLSDMALVLFCIYFYVLKIGDMRSIYSNVKGLWWQHRWRSVVEAVLNIALNIVMAKYWGIYGIIFATILTLLFVNTLWGGRIIFKYYFGMELIKDYFRYQAQYALVTTVLCIFTWIICNLFSVNSLILTLILRAIVCIIFPNIIFILLYKRLPYFKRIKGIILKK